MIRMQQHPEFATWFSRLRDAVALAQIARRIDRLALGKRGDEAPVGKGVSEMRVHAGSGYRVDLVRRGEDIAVLLCGGDKSSQSQNIRRAKALAATL